MRNKILTLEEQLVINTDEMNNYKRKYDEI